MAEGYLGDTGYVEGSRREDGSWSGAPGTDPKTPGVKSYANYSEYWNAHPEMAPSSFTPTTGGLGGFSSFINPNQQNPVATPLATNPTANTGPFTPNTGALAGVVGAGAVGAGLLYNNPLRGSNMANLFQGDPLPAVTKTTETQQTAPEFYTNYLQDIANLGQNAVQQGGVAGFSPLQQQAFQMAPDVAFAGQGSLGAASNLLGQAGSTTVPDVIGDYMNPYTSSVVDEMGRLQNRNIQENVMPALGGAAIGSGQFGSRRQQQITGNTLRDMQADLTGRQGQFLQKGYTDAGTQAQADLERAMRSGQAFTTLGQEQQQLGTGGLKTMFDFGTAQQKQGQALLDNPMEQAQRFAKLMQGYQQPLGETKQVTGPDAGSYSASPLSQIAGLGTMFASLFPNTGETDARKAYWEAMADNAKKTGTTAVVPKTGKDGGSITKRGIRLANGGMAPVDAEYHDGNGNFYDADGYLVEH